MLKSNAVSSCKAWKNSDEPRSGPVFLRYKQNKLTYKKRMSKEQFAETMYYSTDLHEALFKKSSHQFWKTWKSKLEQKRNDVVHVDGITDNTIIVVGFENSFYSNV